MSDDIKSKEVILPSLTVYGVKNNGEHRHFCIMHKAEYVCPHPAICRMHYEVDECGTCHKKRMEGIAFPNIPESNGVAFVGGDGTPLEPINYKLPDPESMPTHMRKSIQELVNAQEESRQQKAIAKAARAALHHN